MQKLAKLNGFWLKVIAMFTMTLDHIGLFLDMNSILPSNHPLIFIFRLIGRFALPLYCFMIVEGVIHTKSFKKYFLRLSIMAIIISISLSIFQFVPQLGLTSLASAGNIFLDLSLGALGVFLLRSKNPYFKLLSLIPLAYSVLSYISLCGNSNLCLIPDFIRLQYGFYSILLIYCFYLSKNLSSVFIRWFEKQNNLLEYSLEDSYIQLNSRTLFSIVSLVVITILYYLISKVTSYNIMSTQNFAIFSGAFLLLYNYKRGYNKKWFEIGCYVFYPGHLLILGGILLLINM